MNQTPLVSVVVLVYNTGDYLLPCLESIAAQTYRNLDVLMIDNGSQDGSGQVCDDFARQDGRFRTIHQENLGIIGGRGTGVTHSRGEYLAFVDGDDLLHPEMVQLLLEECLKTDLPVSCCRFIPFYGPPPEPGECPDDCLTFESPDHLDALMHDKRVEYSLCNKLYARHLFDNIPFYSPVVYNEDLYLNWNILQHARGMAFADFIGYYYRQHAASTTHRPLKDRVLTDQIYVARTILDTARGGPLEASAEAFYYEKLLYLNSMILRQSNARDFNTEHRSLKKEIRTGLGKALKNRHLSTTMKLAAILSCWGGIFYTGLCRLMLTDRR